MYYDSRPPMGLHHPVRVAHNVFEAAGRKQRTAQTLVGVYDDEESVGCRRRGREGV